MSSTIDQLVQAHLDANNLLRAANKAGNKCRADLAAARAEETALGSALGKDEAGTREYIRLVNRATDSSKKFAAATERFQAAEAKRKRLFARVVDQKAAEKLCEMGLEDYAYKAFRG